MTILVSGTANPPVRCELCDRYVTGLTKHHLIPRARHHNKKARKQFERAVMTTQIAWLCRPCHKQVHALFSEKELAESYFEVSRLRKHPEMQIFIEWIANKPADFLPRTYARRR